ncbi:unnamed protein product [Amoebophrya sp. A25]|nr:unnamed protein product [Amoebophrya sp. A25]|eukprot:GSA25T00027121001.1
MECEGDYFQVDSQVVQEHTQVQQVVQQQLQNSGTTRCPPGTGQQQHGRTTREDCPPLPLPPAVAPPDEEFVQNKRLCKGLDSPAQAGKRLLRELLKHHAEEMLNHWIFDSWRTVAFDFEGFRLKALPLLVRAAYNIPIPEKEKQYWGKALPKSDQTQEEETQVPVRRRENQGVDDDIRRMGPRGRANGLSPAAALEASVLDGLIPGDPGWPEACKRRHGARVWSVVTQSRKPMDYGQDRSAFGSAAKMFAQERRMDELVAASRRLAEKAAAKSKELKQRASRGQHMSCADIWPMFTAEPLPLRLHFGEDRSPASAVHQSVDLSDRNFDHTVSMLLDFRGKRDPIPLAERRQGPLPSQNSVQLTETANFEQFLSLPYGIEGDYRGPPSDDDGGPSSDEGSKDGRDDHGRHDNGVELPTAEDISASLRLAEKVLTNEQVGLLFGFEKIQNLIAGVQELAKPPVPVGAASGSSSAGSGIPSFAAAVFARSGHA